MKTYKLNLLVIYTLLLLFIACKKDDADRQFLEEGRVGFDLPANTEVVTRPQLEIKSVSLVSIEMKAALQGNASSEVHYVKFATDTTKLAEYRLKYGNSAQLLPTRSYLFYKQTVSIAPRTDVSEAAVLNLSFQTTLRARTTYVLPIVIESVDGRSVEPAIRKVVYYVFNTGDALYVDHTGFALTATASSVNGANAASNAVDANTLGTYWLSNVAQSLPQWVSVDFKRDISFSGLDYFFPTAANYNTVGGNTTSVKLETSSDIITWTDRGTYAVDIKNTERKQTLNLPSMTTARYLRFTVLAAAPYVSGGVSYSVAFVGGILLRN